MSDHDLTDEEVAQRDQLARARIKDLSPGISIVVMVVFVMVLQLAPPPEPLREIISPLGVFALLLAINLGLNRLRPRGWNRPGVLLRRSDELQRAANALRIMLLVGSLLLTGLMLRDQSHLNWANRLIWPVLTLSPAWACTRQALIWQRAGVLDDEGTRAIRAKAFAIGFWTAALVGAVMLGGAMIWPALARLGLPLTLCLGSAAVAGSYVWLEREG